MRIGLIVFGAVLSAMPLGAAAQQLDASAEQDAVQLLNQQRADAGLPALEVDQRLTDAARQHSQLMAEHKALSHQFEGEPTVRLRISGSGVRFDFSGENVAFNRDAASATAGLMNSPPHRENILNKNYNVVGIGVVRVGRDIYLTQDFAHRLPELSENETERIIARSFDALRKSAGEPPVPLRSEPTLRDLACSMAQNDRLETDLARDLQNVRAVVVWTATDPRKLPDDLVGLRDTKASGWAVGSCFATSRRYPNPVWWNVAVTYF